MPKTIRNVYDKEVSFEKLLEAHRKARRGKREKRNVILLELVLEEQLLQLEKDLKNCTYKHCKYTKFKIYQPKERIINELDQYAKHKLKCKYYYRYMDDMVIMCENKEIAKDSLNNITKFLKENLKLTLNSKTRIFKDIQGVNFCGYKINEKRLKIRHTSKCRMKRKLKRYTRQLKEGKITLPEIQRSIAGWLGYVKHADSYNLRKSMFYIEG